MDARENAKALIGKDEPERIGFFDSFWGELSKKWRDEGHVKEGVACDLFDTDIVTVGGWFDSLPYPGVQELVEETDEWKIVRNGAGASFKWWKNKSGTPEHIDFRMADRDVWERDYRSRLLGLDESRLNLEQAKKNADGWKNGSKFAVYGDLCIWELFRRSAGDVRMFESIAEDPEWVRDFNRVYTDFYIAHFTKLMDECGVPDGVYLYDDLGYSRGLFCSPKALRELYFPFYKELVDFIHSKGAYALLHTCGGIEEALPMIVEAGFDSLNPMEVKAGCDAVRFAEKYGDRLAFVGGFDARVLESGDIPLIKREVKKYMTDMKSVGARFFFGSDHSCSGNVEYASYRAAYET
ncbi:MAG: hypothetical protein FWF03_05310, partial [Defluviitaleaceae bacterium]|nr:hypothetical protein [Defluviitaleaceae bacterium]